MMIDTKALRELAEKAAIGQWTYCQAVDHDGWKRPAYWVHFGMDECAITCDTGGEAYNRDNAAYIAAANPQTILALLDVADAARAHRAECRKMADAVKTVNEITNKLAVQETAQKLDEALATLGGAK